MFKYKIFDKYEMIEWMWDGNVGKAWLRRKYFNLIDDQAKNQT